MPAWDNVPGLGIQNLARAESPGRKPDSAFRRCWIRRCSWFGRLAFFRRWQLAQLRHGLFKISIHRPRLRIHQLPIRESHPRRMAREAGQRAGSRGTSRYSARLNFHPENPMSKPPRARGATVMRASILECASPLALSNARWIALDCEANVRLTQIEFGGVWHIEKGSLVSGNPAGSLMGLEPWRKWENSHAGNEPRRHRDTELGKAGRLEF